MAEVHVIEFSAKGLGGHTCTVYVRNHGVTWIDKRMLVMSNVIR